jgi:glycogen operon protein
MLLHGDELGRTQQGNNNTYAQDSELSWVHWEAADQPLVEVTAAVTRLRAEHPTFRRKRFFTGETVRTGEGERLDDIVWLHPDGRPMADGDWGDGEQQDAPRVLGMYLNGHGIAGADARGGRILDDHFLLYFNAGGTCEVTLPPAEYAEAWDLVIDTGGSASDDAHPAGTTVPLAERSTLVLREHAPAATVPDDSVAASVAHAEERAQEQAEEQGG